MYQVGKYNVDFAGEIYDKETCYQMVIISEWDKNNKLVGKQKTFYFLCVNCSILDCFNTESEIKQIFKQKEYSRFSISTKVNMEIKKL